MFRIVYEIAIAVGLLYLVIWLVMTLMAQSRRQPPRGSSDAGDPGISAFLPHDGHGHHHGHHGMDGGSHGGGDAGGGGSH